MKKTQLKYICTILGFHQVWYQGIVKATVSGVRVFDDLRFKISVGSDQN